MNFTQEEIFKAIGLTQEEIFEALGLAMEKIEASGASIALTDAVVMVGDVRSSIGNKWNPAQHEAAQRVRAKLSPKPVTNKEPEHRCRHGVLWGHCPECPTAEDIECNEAAQAAAAQRKAVKDGTYAKLHAK